MQERGANGEIFVEQFGKKRKLAASEHSKSGVRAYISPDCINQIQIWDGLGGGYCILCAPASFRSTKHCSQQGCTKLKRYGGKCIEHCDPNNEQYIAQKQRDKLRAKKVAQQEKSR